MDEVNPLTVELARLRAVVKRQIAHIGGLGDVIDDQACRLRELRGERDRARDVAVALEQQVGSCHWCGVIDELVAP
jgi:hypothetical protein